MDQNTITTASLQPLKVAIIGAGLAGLTAANRALELGLQPCVFERSSEARHICASRTNGGVFHVGFRSVDAPAEQLEAVIAAATGSHVPAPVRQALAEHAARSVQWLESFGTQMTKLTPDDGWKDRVLAPTGFHDKTTMAWEGLGADLLIARLEARVAELGGRVEKGVTVLSLLTGPAGVIGLRVRDTHGVERDILADAVVVADGGFEGNREMMRQYITPHPENLMLRGYESGHGDGIRMAQAIGARVTGMETFYGHILSADSLHREGLSPFPFLEFLAAAGMLVDESGERFVDETAGGHFTSNALARRGRGLGYVIFDHAMWEGPGTFFFSPPNPNLVKAGGTLHQADSLRALSKLLGWSEQRLEEAAEERQRVRLPGAPKPTNASDATDQTVYSKGKHRHQPFSTGPYYAAPACAALTSTLGGLEIDACARVLNERGEAIGGLYAAGSSVGNVEGGPDVGYLGGLIKALVFGLLAAEHIQIGAAPTP